MLAQVTRRSSGVVFVKNKCHNTQYWRANSDVVLPFEDESSKKQKIDLTTQQPSEPLSETFLLLNILFLPHVLRTWDLQKPHSQTGDTQRRLFTTNFKQSSSTIAWSLQTMAHAKLFRSYYTDISILLHFRICTPLGDQNRHSKLQLEQQTKLI